MGIKRDASIKSKANAPPKRAKLNISPGKQEEIEALTESSDDEIEFEEPMPWTEHPWLNSDKEVLGVTIKGKFKLFRDSSSKIMTLMKKRMKTFKVDDTQIKVVKHVFKKAALCCDTEVVSKNGSKDNIEITLYHSTGTISLLRKPNVDHSFIELIRNVIVSFLEKFVSGAKEEEVIAWSSRTSKPITVKTNTNSCTLCSFVTKSKMALKRHYTIVHTVAQHKNNCFQCDKCQKFYKSKATLETHINKCQIKTVNIENTKEGVIKELERKLEELEQRLQHYQDKEKENISKKQVHENNKEQYIEDNKMFIEEEIEIPSHLRPVNPDHIPFLKGFRMFCQAVGNGACGTNCGAIHTLEDDSMEAGIKMKRKINFHMADNFDDVYSNIIGIPYSETVYGEEDRQICNTSEELKTFLKSDRALQVYSNFQEMQAMSNLFNMPIDIFTYGTRVFADGGRSQIAEWRERILPMAEAAHLAEYEVGHFPPMALYHNDDNHFDLLVEDTSRLVTSGLLGRVQEVQQVPAQLQEEGEWNTVAGRSTRKNPLVSGFQGENQKNKKVQDVFSCDECEACLESQGLLKAHKNNHEELRSKPKFICDDCDENCSSEESLKNHMEEEHDDGAWTCDDCDFQTNKSEPLRQHLKKTGHQPSEASKRQKNEIRQCYTCRKEFEGYTEMMDHRFKEHPTNKICRNIPVCTGLVNGKKCWYVHPENSSDQAHEDSEKSNAPVQQEVECRRCAMKFSSRNQFMTHYTTKHTGHIVCREWLKNNCKRVKCWYLHSNTKPIEKTPIVQIVPTQQDFPQFLPPPQPPAQGPPLAQTHSNQQSEIQKMIIQMAARMSTLELEVCESRRQMQTLQQMLANTVL